MNHKTITADLSKVTYRQLLENTIKWQKSINTLAGDARITLDSPAYSGNFNSNLKLKGEDSLLITVTGPLGVDMGKVFIGAERFIFYNQMQNQFYTGSTSDFAGKNFLQFPVDISQLRSVFLAQDAFNVLKKNRFEVRDNQYYLEASNNQRNYHIWFDPRYLLISRIEYREQDELIHYKEYNQYQNVDGVFFPQSINFVKPYERQGIAIFFNDLKINQPIDGDDFRVKVSDSAEQIDLSLQN
ncbi:MAG: DUF4292 domain-containing protein [Caldithrix sp.]|nr:DUF4292 domain-containing protein [Caldithrix sp.]